MDYNRLTAIGKVRALQFRDTPSGKQATFYLVVNNRESAGNGQWVDKATELPVVAEAKKAELLEKYVVEGQELTIDAQYFTWEREGVKGHAFRMTSVVFGFKPRNTDQNSRPSNPAFPD